MNIGQFLLIFWARRVVIGCATLACLFGAILVCSLLPPRWESTVRVMLNSLKPDPVTGEVVAGPAMRVYVQTQQELVTDYSSASKVAEQIGWFSDPSLIRQYEKRSKNDQRDFRRFLADIVIENSKAKLVEGSNIMEISYTATTAKSAKAVTDALLKGYMDAALEYKREDAERNAVWYADRTEKAKQALDAAVATEAAYSRENGVVMQGDRTDADTARLQSLTMQGAPLQTPFVPSEVSSPASMQLAELDAQISAASKVLGPNNPGMVELRQRRESLAALVERDKANQRAYAAHEGSGGGSALARAVAQQKAQVLANSEKVGRLTQLHQDVELRREQYNRMSAKTAQYREEAMSTDIGVVPLGTATTPKKAKFPNWTLILPGALVLGLAVGVLVSLLMELISRRVRAPEDLELVGDIKMICVIPGPERRRTDRPNRTTSLRRFFARPAPRA